MKADLLLEDVNVNHVDILVFTGGDLGPFCDDGVAADEVKSLILQHLENKMFVAAICSGQRALVSAGVLDGVAAAEPPLADSWPGYERVDWKKHRPFVKSGHILTASDPEHADLFAQELLKILGRAD